MKLVRLILKDVRCYKYIEINFEGKRNKGIQELRNRTVILGNNGTGKSTILRAIALILAGSSALGELIGKPNNWIRNGADSCLLKADLILKDQQKQPIELSIYRNDNLSTIISRNEANLRKLDALLQNNEQDHLIIGYGVHRRIGGKGLKANTSNYQQERANNIATLFDANAALYPFESWLMDIDYRKGEKGLNKVKKALEQLIPEATFHKIDKENRVVQFKNKDGIVDFAQLSDGLQITINWLGDILYRIEQADNDIETLFDASFVLLLDEIALHLHPAWQRVILQSIGELFKNAQIIITTHSPFVAQQASYAELYTIIRNKANDLDLFHYQNDPRKLLIHQIIMSDIFGLSTDESVAVEEAKNKIRKDPRKNEEIIIKSGDLVVENLEAMPLKELSDVENLSDLPLNLYSYESGIDYKQLMDKLNEEIKKLNNNDTPKSKSRE